MALQGGTLSKPRRADVNALVVLMAVVVAKAPQILIAAVDAQITSKTVQILSHITKGNQALVAFCFCKKILLRHFGGAANINITS